jgi:hypothetical protein
MPVTALDESPGSTSGRSASIEERYGSRTGYLAAARAAAEAMVERAAQRWDLIDKGV